ncbi:MAG: putative ATP-binding protein involved in virulence [Patiriisocius sp.]
MLKKYTYKGQEYNLGPDYENPDKNIFTVIVGKNGTGKSRLLKSIIEEFIGHTNRRGEINRSRDLFSSELDKLDIYHKPNNIIAVSTSPFDKFPLIRNNRNVNNYSYLGLRNLRANDLGMAYMSKVFTSLVSATLKSDWAAKKISSVLNYLGYEGYLEGRYHLELHPSRMRDVLGAIDDVSAFIHEFLTESNSISYRRLNSKYFFDEDTISHQKVEEFLSIYKTMISHTNRPRISILISSDGAHSPELPNLNRDFQVLVDSGIIGLRDLTVRKKNTVSPFLISDASSGEQSVVMSILGIASEIKDGSLICIDEPEVCLHPQWQEKYIELLISTFKEFKSCHFLIATHSPLIVSKLENDNCFVMSMDDGFLQPASEINNRSVDFQLAHTFKTPGFKNEFLTRVLMSHLATFSENGELNTEETNEVKSILKLQDFISENDPVKKLMTMIEEAIEGEH